MTKEIRRKPIDQGEGWHALKTSQAMLSKKAGRPIYLWDMERMLLLSDKELKLSGYQVRIDGFFDFKEGENASKIWGSLPSVL